MCNFKFAIIFRISLGLIFLVLCQNFCYALPEGHFADLRQEMVSRQIEARGVKDPRVLDAMLAVPRHKFVPKPLEFLAYKDQPLPIGEGQTISQPYIVALMTESLQLDGDEKVLEIGTGSGYQAAILSLLAQEVYTVEILKGLAETADGKLKELGYKNVHVACRDGWLGWPEHAPFDAIIVTCAPDDIPKELVNELKDGGRMVLPLGNQYPQQLILITKEDGQITQVPIIPCRFVPMVHGQ